MNKNLSKDILSFIAANPGCNTLNVWRAFRPSRSVGSALQRLQRSGRICVDKHTQPHKFYHPSYFESVTSIYGTQSLLTYLSQYVKIFPKATIKTGKKTRTISISIPL